MSSEQSKAVRETGMLSIVLCLVMAVAWVLLAPEIHGEVTEEGVRVPVTEARQLFGVDGWFALTGAAAGLIAGTAAIVRHRRHQVTALLAAVGWGAVGSVLAWRLGMLVGPGSPDGVPAGATVAVQLELGAPGVLLAWPVAAVVAVAVAAAFLGDHTPWQHTPAPVSRADRSAPSVSP